MQAISYKIERLIHPINKDSYIVNEKDIGKFSPEFNLVQKIHRFADAWFNNRKKLVKITIKVEVPKKLSNTSTVSLDISPNQHEDQFPEATLQIILEFINNRLDHLLSLLEESMKLTLNKQSHTVLTESEVLADENCKMLICDDQLEKKTIESILSSKSCAGHAVKTRNGNFTLPSKSRFLKNIDSEIEDRLTIESRVHKIGYDGTAETIGERELLFYFDEKYFQDLMALSSDNATAIFTFEKEENNVRMRLVNIEPSRIGTLKLA